MPAPPAPSSSPSSPDASPSSLSATPPRTPYRPTIFPYIDSSTLSDPALNAVAGATAGFVSGIFVCPLDVIKTKLQAQGGFLRQRYDPAQIPGQPLRYRGLTGTFKMILQEEGIRGMYRGLAPLVLGYLPTWMVYFTVYGRAKVYMEGVIEHKPLNHLTCSVIAGASSTLCTNPIWVIKTRLMSQQASLTRSLASLRTSPYHYQNTLDAARKMYAHEGIRSFYSGLGPALLGLTHVAVQFPLYEFLKGKFTGGVGLGQTGEGGGTDYVGVLAASALSKMAASSATYPHEVLRTRLQTQRVLLGHVVEQVGMEGQQGGRAEHYRGIVRSVRTIWREEGWRAFYAGMGTNLVRAVPASAVTMLTFEAIMSRLLRIREEGRLARCPVA